MKFGTYMYSWQGDPNRQHAGFVILIMLESWH